MAHDKERELGPTHEDAATQAREGHVGRMSPIDPGVGPGGTTAETDHTDVASGGVGPGADDVRTDDIRNDVRDPGKAYGADRGMAENR